MILTRSVYATCPVCVVTVGGGLWLAEKLGVDDLIAAIWIGALVTALAIAFASYKKQKPFFRSPLALTVLFYLATLATLMLSGKIDNLPFCQIWGTNKIILGLTGGTLALWVGAGLDKFLRRYQREGKAFFPFQKVILPFLTTCLLSLISYYFLCS